MHLLAVGCSVGSTQYYIQIKIRVHADERQYKSAVRGFPKEYPHTPACVDPRPRKGHEVLGRQRGALRPGIKPRGTYIAYIVPTYCCLVVVVLIEYIAHSGPAYYSLT